MSKLNLDTKVNKRFLFCSVKRIICSAYIISLENGPYSDTKGCFLMRNQVWCELVRVRTTLLGVWSRRSFYLIKTRSTEYGLYGALEWSTRHTNKLLLEIQYVVMSEIGRDMDACRFQVPRNDKSHSSQCSHSCRAALLIVRLILGSLRTSSGSASLYLLGQSLALCSTYAGGHIVTRLLALYFRTRGIAADRKRPVSIRQ